MAPLLAYGDHFLFKGNAVRKQMYTMETSSLPPRRILVIDDDPTLLAAVTEGLDILGGCTVFMARDGISGLETFFSTRPDCVVVDVRIPGIDGYQFVRALRGDPATVETPVVILSALVQDQEQLAGLLTGADIYLIKPVRIVDLIQAIHYAVTCTSESRREQLRGLFGDTASRAETNG
jgi:DNA-binding response OmpR family regulator